MNMLMVILALFIIGCKEERRYDITENNSHARYLLFPNRTEGEIHRAIIVSGDELFDSQKISYFDNNEIMAIDKTMLSLLPPKSLKKEYINKLNEAIADWGANTDIKKVDFTYNNHHAKLIIFYKGGDFTTFSYTIGADGCPYQIEIYNSH